MIQAWNISDVIGDLEEFEQEKIQKAVEVFQFTGEDFINKCRNLRTYKDRTGNLRSSIGYMILVEGDEVTNSFPNATGVPKYNATGAGEGRREAERLTKGDKGLVMVGVAGMEYGRSVESKGYDVITGPSQGVKTLLKSLVKEI